MVEFVEGAGADCVDFGVELSRAPVPSTRPCSPQRKQRASIGGFALYNLIVSHSWPKARHASGAYTLRMALPPSMNHPVQARKEPGDGHQRRGYVILAGEGAMAKVTPWHSTKKSSVGNDIYHNNTDCHTGDNIKPENIRWGTGTGRRLCWLCRGLNKRERKKD